MLGKEYGEPIDTMTRFGKLTKSWITARERGGVSCFIFAMGVYHLMETIDRDPQIAVHLNEGISDHGWVEVGGYAIDLDPAAHITKLMTRKNGETEKSLINRIRKDGVLIVSVYSDEYNALISGESVERFDRNNTSKWEEHYMQTRDMLFENALIPPDISHGLKAVDKALG